MLVKWHNVIGLLILSLTFFPFTAVGKPTYVNVLSGGVFIAGDHATVNQIGSPHCSKSIIVFYIMKICCDLTAMDSYMPLR